MLSNGSDTGTTQQGDCVARKTWFYESLCYRIQILTAGDATSEAAVMRFATKLLRRWRATAVAAAAVHVLVPGMWHSVRASLCASRIV